MMPTLDTRTVRLAIIERPERLKIAKATMNKKIAGEKLKKIS